MCCRLREVFFDYLYLIGIEKEKHEQMLHKISQKARVPFRALFCSFTLALFNMLDKSLQTIQMPWTSLNIKTSNIDCVHTTTKKRAHAWQFNRPNEIYKNCQTQHTETASMLWSKVGQNCSQRKANKNGFPYPTDARDKPTGRVDGNKRMIWNKTRSNVIHTTRICDLRPHLPHRLLPHRVVKCRGKKKQRHRCIV